MTAATVADAPASPNEKSNENSVESRDAAALEESRAAFSSSITIEDWQTLSSQSGNVVSDNGSVIPNDSGSLNLDSADPLAESNGKPLFMTTEEALRKVPEGDGQVADHPLVRENTEQLDYAAERERLLNNLSPEQRAQAEENIAKLESPDRRPPLTQQELARIYKATSDLIENKDGAQPPLMNDQQRQLMAASILDNTANNTDIDQGYNNTCNVTTLEEQLATKDAAAYAELMSDVSRHAVPAGQQHGRDVVAWQSPDGQTIYMDRNSLMPDQEARPQGADGGLRDGDRNYASQVFDMLTVNQYWQSVDPGALYTKDTPTGPADTGERLINSGGRVVSDSPYMGAEAMAAVGRQLGLGDKNNPFMVTNSISDGRYNVDGVVQVSSEADLQRELERAEANGGFPMVIMVHTGHEMFRDSSNQGGSGGWHVINVTGRNPDGTWQVSNQWGESYDGSFSTHQIYQATLGPDKAQDGYSGGGAIHGGGGGGQQGGSGHGMVRDEDFQKFKDDFNKTGEEGNDATQRQIDKIRHEIETLRGQEGSEGRILSLESEINVLSLQLHK